MVFEASLTCTDESSHPLNVCASEDVAHDWAVVDCVACYAASTRFVANVTDLSVSEVSEGTNS